LPPNNLALVEIWRLQPNSKCSDLGFLISGNIFII